MLEGDPILRSTLLSAELCHTVTFDVMLTVSIFPLIHGFGVHPIAACNIISKGAFQSYRLA